MSWTQLSPASDPWGLTIEQALAVLDDGDPDVTATTVARGDRGEYLDRCYLLAAAEPNHVEGGRPVRPPPFPVTRSGVLPTFQTPRPAA